MKKVVAAGVALFLLGAGVSYASQMQFKDVKPTDWFYGDVQKLSDWGVIKGNPDGNFNPSGTVNRAELAAILSRYDAHLASKPMMETYTDTQYGFSFQYPAGSTIETSHNELGQYVRFQNYTDADMGTSHGLPAGKYYLELFVHDKDLGETINNACADEVRDMKTVQVGTKSGFRGLGPIGGDPGGERYALCVQASDKVQVYLQATEDGPTGPIANGILDSFKFTK